MKAPFDDIATDYDRQFTHSLIGKLQREKVWHHLIHHFGNSFPAKVLELNCGTGEDAIFFARQGSEVLATDVSEKMLNITLEKTEVNNVSSLVSTTKLDITRIHAVPFTSRFNLVFSNFGGLNCISPSQLQQLLEKLPELLVPKGRLILVLMPRFCIWESLYYLSRFRMGTAFRRSIKKQQQAHLGKGKVNTWYYSPSQIQEMAGTKFRLVALKPVGITLPPSYFNKTMFNTPKILNALNGAEQKLNRYKTLAYFSDHFLIDLELQ